MAVVSNGVTAVTALAPVKYKLEPSAISDVVCPSKDITVFATFAFSDAGEARAETTLATHLVPSYIKA